MMNHKCALGAPLAVLLFLASCANLPLTETGFLGDYSQLKPAPELEVWGIPDTVHAFRSEGLDQPGFDSILVEPAVWSPSEKHGYRPSEERTQWLLDEYTSCLEKILSENYELVDSAGSGTLRVRPALTAVEPANPWINAPMTLLLLPADMGGLSGEIEVLDGLTGERLFAMTARRESGPFLVFEAFSWYGYALHGMYKWSLLLAQELQPRE
ncbi:MAG: hypothetical protein ACI8QC_001880 [Planctomycetota bacterium]|jgi:hypothetical protein